MSVGRHFFEMTSKQRRHAARLTVPLRQIRALNLRRSPGFLPGAPVDVLERFGLTPRLIWQSGALGKRRARRRRDGDSHSAAAPPHRGDARRSVHRRASSDPARAPADRCKRETNPGADAARSRSLSGAACALNARHRASPARAMDQRQAGGRWRRFVLIHCISMHDKTQCCATHCFPPRNPGCVAPATRDRNAGGSEPGGAEQREARTSVSVGAAVRACARTDGALDRVAL